MISCRGSGYRPAACVQAETIHAMMPMTDSLVSESDIRGSRSCATDRGRNSQLPRLLPLLRPQTP